MHITVPELAELSTRNVTMCSVRSPGAGPYEQPYRNWQSSVPEMSLSVLSIIQVPVRGPTNYHTGTGTELGCAFRFLFRFLPGLIFQNQFFFRGTRVQIKSFLGKINLFWNPTESGIPAGILEGRKDP